MLTCPYCEWPFASRNELVVHIEIKHRGSLSKLLCAIQDETRSIQIDELDDDGLYTSDEVIHQPYDDDDWLEEYDYTEGDIGQDGEI